jgi:hypothetical protein
MHARLADGQAQLLTRTGLDWSKQYSFTIEALRSLPAPRTHENMPRCHPPGLAFGIYQQDAP